MTLDQALHILLMYSANDAAMLIAENIGGSVDHFVEMMNEEAQRLGLQIPVLPILMVCRMTIIILQPMTCI